VSEWSLTKTAKTWPWPCSASPFSKDRLTASFRCRKPGILRNVELALTSLDRLEASIFAMKNDDKRRVSIAAPAVFGFVTLPRVVAIIRSKTNQACDRFREATNRSVSTSCRAAWTSESQDCLWIPACLNGRRLDRRATSAFFIPHTVSQNKLASRRRSEAASILCCAVYVWWLRCIVVSSRFDFLTGHCSRDVSHLLTDIVSAYVVGECL